MENEITFLKAASKFNNNIGLLEFVEQLYPEALGDYAKEKFQMFRKDFFRWFTSLNLEKQTKYITLVNQTV